MQANSHRVTAEARADRFHPEGESPCNDSEDRDAVEGASELKNAIQVTEQKFKAQIETLNTNLKVQTSKNKDLRASLKVAHQRITELTTRIESSNWIRIESQYCNRKIGKRIHFQRRHQVFSDAFKEIISARWKRVADQPEARLSARFNDMVITGENLEKTLDEVRSTWTHRALWSWKLPMVITC